MVQTGGMMVDTDLWDNDDSTDLWDDGGYRPEV